LAIYPILAVIFFLTMAILTIAPVGFIYNPKFFKRHRTALGLFSSHYNSATDSDFINLLESEGSKTELFLLSQKMRSVICLKVYPGRFTESPCIISSGSDFSRLLGVAYNSPELRIRYGLGQKYHNRDVLNHGEPLIFLAGPPARKLVVTEQSAIAFNLPQALEPIHNLPDQYRVNLQMKVVRPDLLRVFEIPPPPAD
jgi:hypothetical protein